MNRRLLFAHDYVLKYKQAYKTLSFGKSSDLDGRFKKINKLGPLNKYSLNSYFGPLLPPPSFSKPHCHTDECVPTMGLKYRHFIPAGPHFIPTRPYMVTRGLPVHVRIAKTG